MGNDTQWPTFVVFHQAQPDRPHLHAGSVHASDSELAMMNARDVFVRRPPCVSLWVAPVKAVYSRTREQLADPDWAQDEGKISGVRQTYMIFKKSQQAGACAFYSEVEAETAPAALKMVLDTGTSDEGLVWWVIPASQVNKSQPGEIESMFSPAEAKPFRHQSEFDTLTQMRRLAAEQSKRNQDGT
jgi:ring-1,2-phenylacetyl-CoA epoxidase subunit PaaB